MVNADYLKVKVEHHGPVCVLAVSGDLDLFTSARFTQSAAAALKIPAERFILDLSGLRFIDCCGTRTLAATTRAVPADCPVIVRSLHPAVRRVLDLMGLNLELRESAVDDHAASLAGQAQLLCSRAQQVVAESYKLAETLAATEDRVADTLIRLAGSRHAKADRLTALSQTARTQAAQFRTLAR